MTTFFTPERERIKALDRQLVAIINDFLLLAPLSWPKATMIEFMASVRQGNPILPEVVFPEVDYQERIAALTNYIEQLGKDDHPAICLLRDTAKSYHHACLILQGIGTTQVNEHSKLLYGSPQDVVSGYKRKNLEVARYFLKVVDRYKAVTDAEQVMCFNAEQFAQALQHAIVQHIDPEKDTIAVTVSDEIVARAAAGSSYVKVRAGTMFSHIELEQLLHHEVLTHTLTYINGRKQPILSILGYNAPRVTATQEGLAVFSEYINFTIELSRLKRIALRIIALNLAEQGADLIELFRFFKKHGQDDEESYYASMRTLRGGHPQGGVVFYKDNVYLRGLLDVEAILKRAMHHGDVHEMTILFSGKLAAQDIPLLCALQQEGYVDEPAYLPPWIKQTGQLAAHLAFNDITERFGVKKGKG